MCSVPVRVGSRLPQASRPRTLMRRGMPRTVADSSRLRVGKGRTRASSSRVVCGRGRMMLLRSSFRFSGPSGVERVRLGSRVERLLEKVSRGRVRVLTAWRGGLLLRLLPGRLSRGGPSVVARTRVRPVAMRQAVVAAVTRRRPGRARREAPGALPITVVRPGNPALRDVKGRRAVAVHPATAARPRVARLRVAQPRAARRPAVWPRVGPEVVGSRVSRVMAVRVRGRVRPTGRLPGRVTAGSRGRVGTRKLL